MSLCIGVGVCIYYDRHLQMYHNDLTLIYDICTQDDFIQSVVTVTSQPTSIPLLMACTTNVKTVVANPLVYLTNLTHDILQTISALDSPPHPDVVTNEVRQLISSLSR